MQLSKSTSEIYVPDGLDVEAALKRVTHVAVSAHQDDIEIMAMDGVLKCFGLPDKWFMGVVVTDGAGSPRDGLYARYTDAEMRGVRRVEQKKAAFVGEYAAAAFLDQPSSAVKSPADPGPKNDIKALLAAARPEVVYTHNLADTHDTHVAAAPPYPRCHPRAAARGAPEEILRWRGLARPGLDDRLRQGCLHPRRAPEPGGRAAGRVRLADRGREALRPGQLRTPPGARHLSSKPRHRCRRDDQLRDGHDAPH